jgi:hypothetical protein
VKRDLVLGYARTAPAEVQRFLAMRYGSYFGERRDFSMKECAAALKLSEEQLLAWQKAMLRDVLPKLLRSPDFNEHRPVVSPLSPDDPPSRNG